MIEKTSNSLKLTLIQLGGKFWTGGTTYLKNLLEAITLYAPETIISVFADEHAEPLTKYENVTYYTLKKITNRVPLFINQITSKFFSYDFVLSQSLKEIKTGIPDVIFPSKLRAGRDIAVIYWIPDFQFLHLPEMYSQSQIRAIDRNFKKGIENCSLLLLSSYDALNDLKNFMPESVKKARVVSFVAHIPENLYKLDLISVIKKYNLPEKFFYLPNQFWKHKNHILVFKALKILKNRGIKPFIVMTGNPVDSRNPLHFAELITKVSEWGLRDQLAFLGLVKHEEVYMLIRQSVCVINPSTFEGWSTTVEEAKSVGKKVLLSDINVHREQDAPESKFFSPNDPEELAKILAEEWEQGKGGPDFELEEMARRELPTRMKIFSERFISVALEAVRIRRGVK